MSTEGNVREGTASQPAESADRRLGLRVSSHSLYSSRDHLAVATARRAWDLGVRLFELGPPGDPVALMVGLKTTVPEIARSGRVLLDGSSTPSAGRVPAALREPPHAEESLLGILHACAAARGSRGLDGVEIPVELTVGPVPPGGLPRPDPSIQVVGIVSGSSSTESVRAAAESGVSGFNLAHNLLEPADPELLEATGRDGSCTVYVRDPFAQGRLLGGFRSDTPVGPTPSGRPATLEELERRWGPVTRFAFLTADRRRTLDQAALRYCLQSHPTSTVLLDSVGPAELTRLLSQGLGPELTSAELDEIRRVQRRLE